MKDLTTYLLGTGQVVSDTFIFQVIGSV